MPTSTGTRPATCLRDRANQLLPQAIAQARRFAGRAQNEQAVHAAADQVLDQPLERRPRRACRDRRAE